MSSTPIFTPSPLFRSSHLEIIMSLSQTTSVWRRKIPNAPNCSSPFLTRLLVIRDDLLTIIAVASKPCGLTMARFRLAHLLMSSAVLLTSLPFANLYHHPFYQSSGDIWQPSAGLLLMIWYKTTVKCYWAPKRGAEHRDRFCSRWAPHLGWGRDGVTEMWPWFFKHLSLPCLTAQATLRKRGVGGHCCGPCLAFYSVLGH